MTLDRWTLALVLPLAVAACSTGEATEDGAAGASAPCADGDEACKARKREEGNEPSTPSATDGKKDGTETDIDCGGPGDAPRCEDGKACAAATDCVSQVCKDAKCQAPRDDDAVKNGDETDVDCGGKNAKTCAVGKTCKAHADCATDGCDYKGKCTLTRSCAGHFGGDTCGSGEVGQAGAKHENCCTTAPISSDANATQLDKYVITSGRMRQFVERTNGNLRAFAAGLGNDPNWNQAWNDQLPASIGEVNYLLGPTGHGTRAGCDNNESRARTYWMTNAENDALGDGHHAFTKDILDQKAINCVEFYMLQALCIWDGGRLATQSEIQTAWQAGESRVYPWGGADFDASRVVFQSNYQFPEIYDQGNSIYVAAPGRRPEGNGKFGHADLAGLVFEITSDVNGANIKWSGSGSWEGHGVSPNGTSYGETTMARAYWATGGRCAHATPP